MSPTKKSRYQEDIDYEIRIWDGITNALIVGFSMIRTGIYARRFIMECFMSTSIWVEVLSWMFCIVLFLLVYFLIIRPVYKLIAKGLSLLHSSLGAIASLLFLSITMELTFRSTIGILKWICSFVS